MKNVNAKNINRMSDGMDMLKAFTYANTAVKVEPKDGLHSVKLIAYEVKAPVFNQVDAEERVDPHTGERRIRRAYLRDPLQPPEAVIRPEAIILKLREEGVNGGPAKLFDVYLGNYQLKQRTELDPSCMWIKFMDEIAEQTHGNTSMLSLQELLEYLKKSGFNIWSLKKPDGYYQYFYNEKDYDYWADKNKQTFEDNKRSEKKSA